MTRTPIVDKPLTIAGHNLTVAWLNAFLATGQDEDDPRTYRTITVELHPHGIQCIATDRHLVFGAFAPLGDLSPPPGMDEAPLATWLVTDYDKRGVGLMKYAAGEAKAAEKNETDYLIELATGSAEAADRPTLNPALDRQALVIRVPGEELRLPLLDMTPLPWRSLLAGHEPEATESIDLSPGLLARFGQLKGGVIRVRCSFAGPDGAIAITSDSECGFFGGVQPLKSTAHVH